MIPVTVETFAVIKTNSHRRLSALHRSSAVSVVDDVVASFIIVIIIEWATELSSEMT